MAKRASATGLRSEQLKSALARALEGEPRLLRDLLSRHGGLPSPRPNLDLAAAFGEEIAPHGAKARRLLEALAREEADTDRAEAFLPVAAAFGFASLLLEGHGAEGGGAARGAEEAACLRALYELASDERPPVRLGALGALEGLGKRQSGGADRLARCFAEWVDEEEREPRWWALSVALELIADRQAVAGLKDPPALFEVVDRIIDDVVNAPRAAERSGARRRVLKVLPAALATMVTSLRGGSAWLEARCGDARDPGLREVLDEAIERLRKRGGAEKAETLRALTSALASSAKPPRDPSRSNEPARGRGRKARGKGA
jgi:hypothetical protein